MAFVNHFFSFQHLSSCNMVQRWRVGGLSDHALPQWRSNATMGIDNQSISSRICTTPGLSSLPASRTLADTGSSELNTSISLEHPGRLWVQWRSPNRYSSYSHVQHSCAITTSLMESSSACVYWPQQCWKWLQWVHRKQFRLLYRFIIAYDTIRVKRIFIGWGQ